jgi:hypothetical protein
MLGLLTSTRPVGGPLSGALTAASRYLRREFELWRWRRAYARRLPPPPQDTREPVLEPCFRLAPRWAPGREVRSALERVSAPRRPPGPGRRLVRAAPTAEGHPRH